MKLRRENLLVLLADVDKGPEPRPEVLAAASLPTSDLEREFLRLYDDAPPSRHPDYLRCHVT